ncbi:MAG: hypothetical protein GY953_08875, partial [bacterium]|nr:hypothetical protein [bacterium]
MTRKGKLRQMPLPNYSGRFVTAKNFTRTVVGDDLPPSAIYLVDAAGGEPVTVEAGDWKGKGHTSMPVWSNDSSKLAFRVIHPKMKKEQIRVIDAKTGQSVGVWEELDERWVYWSDFGFSPDSSQVWFVSEKDGWAHVYRVPTEGGEAVQVTKGSWEARPERLSFHAGGGPGPQWIGDYIYYPSTEDGTSERHFYRIKPDGTGKEKLSTREGVSSGIVSEDGQHIAWLVADLNNPDDLWVDDYRVTSRALPEFLEYRWPETRFVSFPSRGDRKPVAAK